MQALLLVLSSIRSWCTARGLGLGRGRSIAVHGLSVGMFLAMSPPDREVPDRREEFYTAWIESVVFYTEHYQHIYCLLTLISGSCILLVDCYLCFLHAIYNYLPSFSGISLLAR